MSRHHTRRHARARNAHADTEHADRISTSHRSKACIDQRDIERSLRFLPVFLSGCQKLLVLAGPTYTSRLWCMMELYVFLKMGANASRVMVIPIGEDKPSLRVVYQELASFDLQRAQCTDERDREKLLQCVASGFGDDMTAFNVAVRRLIRKSLWRPQLSSGSSLGESLSSQSLTSLESEAART